MMKWSNEERGQPVVKGDMADLFEVHNKRLKAIELDIGMMMIAQWAILAMLVLFVFAPELWVTIKSWVLFFMRWMP